MILNIIFYYNLNWFLMLYNWIIIMSGSSLIWIDLELLWWHLYQFTKRIWKVVKNSNYLLDLVFHYMYNYIIFDEFFVSFCQKFCFFYVLEVSTNMIDKWRIIFDIFTCFYLFSNHNFLFWNRYISFRWSMFIDLFYWIRMVFVCWLFYL